MLPLATEGNTAEGNERIHMTAIQTSILSPSASMSHSRRKEGHRLCSNVRIRNIVEGETPMECKGNTCEYIPTMKRSINRSITPQQRIEALAFLYNARDQCLHEGREDLAKSFQQEINKLEIDNQKSYSPNYSKERR